MDSIMKFGKIKMNWCYLLVKMVQNCCLLKVIRYICKLIKKYDKKKVKQHKTGNILSTVIPKGKG